MIGDVAVEVYPWHLLSRQGLLHGRLPLWNPYAYGGSPLMANGISAPLSPFTLPFTPLPPGFGLSLAMLLKLWVAGIGTAWFVRRLGTHWLPAVLGGLAFSASSFMVVWLGYPTSSVAALVPWGFAAVEWYVAGGGRRPLAALGVVIGLQFLAGHPETSLHFTGALALYAAFRVLVSGPGRWRRLGGLALSGVLGLMLGAVQLTLFVDLLRHDPFFSSRVASGIGSSHLPLSDAWTWLVPNRFGNPAFPGPDGPLPNYNEAVGFAGVWAVTLAVPGAVWLWHRRPHAAVGLIAIGLIAGGVVYGPLSSIAGMIPLLNGAGDARLLVVVTFVVAVLGAAGLEGVLSWAATRTSRRRLSRVVPALLVALAALVVLAGAEAIVLRRPGTVTNLLPPMRGSIGFWLVAAGAALASTGALVGLALNGLRRTAAVGFAMVALLEAAMFAGPYNPRIRPEESPPPSTVMSWLHDNAGGRAVVFVGAAPPESAGVYGVRDVAGYDPFIEQRSIDYWTGTGGATLDGLALNMRHPSVARMRAAGVAYVVAASGSEVSGLPVVMRADGVSIAAVGGQSGAVYAASQPRPVASSREALSAVDASQGDTVAIEGGTAMGGGRPSSLIIDEQGPEHWQVRVSGDSTATLVFVDSFDDGWHARVDGGAVPVHPANVVLKAIEVPAGAHTVTLDYEPRALPVGLLASVLGALGLLALTFWPRLNPLRRHRGSGTLGAR